MNKKNDWFLNYENQRDLNYRVNNFLKKDFENASVIDVGCNTGQLCRYASDMGAKNVLGIDYDNTAICNAREYSKKYDNIVYLTDDIDNFIFYTNLPMFDTGLFFSVIGTQELENRYGILSKLSSKISNVMYIEGHHSVFKKEQLLKAILDYTTFTNIEYIGGTYDNESYEKNGVTRDLFRCSRKELDKNEAIYKINALINDDTDKIIAIQGHGGVGKSTLKMNLISYLNDNTNFQFNLGLINKDKKGIFVSTNKHLCIIDDVVYSQIDFKSLKQKHKYIIYIDYAVLNYLRNDNIHTLFIYNYDIKMRFQNRAQCIENRSPNIKNFIGNIYHIEKYNK